MAQTKDFYAVLGVLHARRRTRSRRRTASSPRSTIPTRTRTTRRRPSASRRSPRRTTSSATPAKRKQYDEMRRLGAFDGGGFGGSAAARSSRGAALAAPAAAAQSINFEDFDIGGLGGLGDLFSSMFGGGEARQSARPRGPERGQTSKPTLEIPFRTAALGGKVPIELEVNEECATCHGTARRPGAKIKTCPECNGRGDDLVRSGRIRGESSVSDVPRPRPGADRALPDVPRDGRSARREEGDDHRARRRRHRLEDPAEGAGRKGTQTVRRAISSSRSTSRPTSSTGATGSTSSRRCRLNIAQATLGIEDQRQDARREESRDQDSAGNAVGKTIPRARAGNREGETRRAT